MARVNACDKCMESNTLSLATTVDIKISITDPAGHTEYVKESLECCQAHMGPIAAYLKARAAQTPPAPPAPPIPPPPGNGQAPVSGGERVGYFECPECPGVTFDTKSRGVHARNVHAESVYDIRWIPLFDQVAHGWFVCECGYACGTKVGFTRHLNATGHREVSDRHPLKSDDFDTTTGKALLEAVGK